MATFSFLRKPVKPLLYGMLLALLSCAALIFSLQYRLDRQALDDSLENYAFLGVAYPDIETNAMLSPLPESGEAILREADTVSSISTMRTCAAKLLNGATIPDYMMSMSQLNQRYFLQVRIYGTRSLTVNKSDPIHYDSYSFEVIKQWGAETVGNRGPQLLVIHLAEEPAWEIGQELFFNCGYSIDNNSVAVTSFSFITPAAYEAMTGQTPDNVLDANPFFLLAEGQGDAEILQFMEETGILPYYEKYAELSNNITVRSIESMTELFNAAKGRLYVAYGRALTEDDAGKKVCMISQNLMLRNRYFVGDTITLSIAPESYSLGGWENGNPSPEDPLITTYAPSETYEIVGIYHQRARDTADPLYYSHNDILIPSETEADALPLPYAFTFRVTGPDYDEFQEKTVPALTEAGCAVRLIDNGWEDVADTFYAMEVRCKLMFWCAVLLFLIAAVTFALLLHRHLQKEYGLQRLLGAYRREACRIFFAATGVFAVPALALSGAAGQWIFNRFLRSEGASDMTLLILLLPAALLAAICLLLPLLTAFSERGSVRDIIM